MTKDKDGTVSLWLSEPQKSTIGDYYIGCGEMRELDSTEFPDLKWGKITEVTLEIKRDAKAC